MNLLTYGTLATEALVGILVWNRTLRPWVLGLGFAMHVGIDLTIRVGFFSYGMFVLYLAFLSPAVAGTGLLALEKTGSGPGSNRAGTRNFSDAAGFLQPSGFHDQLVGRVPGWQRS